MITKKCGNGAERVLTAVISAAVSLTFHTDVLLIHSASTQQDYDAYLRPDGDRSENKRAWTSRGADMDAGLEKDVL